MNELPKSANFVTFACEQLLKFFPKMTICCWKSDRIQIRIQLLPVRRPRRTRTKWGDFPQSVFCKVRSSKSDFPPMLLNERRCNLAFSRRIFLRHGVLAAAACAASPFSAMALSGPRIPLGSSEETDLRKSSGAGSDTWQDHAMALDHLDRTAFSGAVGTNFKVLTGADQLSVWVTLLAVEDLPALAPVNTGEFCGAQQASGLRARQQRLCPVVWRIVTRAAGYPFV